MEPARRLEILRRIVDALNDVASEHNCKVLLVDAEDNKEIEWTSFQEFCQLVGKSAQHVSRKLKHPNCPSFVKKGDRRISHLEVNVKLVEFVQQYGNATIKDEQ
jgi:hypothetical protein